MNYSSYLLLGMIQSSKLRYISDIATYQPSAPPPKTTPKTKIEKLLESNFLMKKFYLRLLTALYANIHCCPQKDLYSNEEKEEFFFGLAQCFTALQNRLRINLNEYFCEQRMNNFAGEIVFLFFNHQQVQENNNWMNTCCSFITNIILCKLSQNPSPEERQINIEKLFERTPTIRMLKYSVKTLEQIDCRELNQLQQFIKCRPMNNWHFSLFSNSSELQEFMYRNKSVILDLYSDYPKRIMRRLFSTLPEDLTEYIAKFIESDWQTIYNSRVAAGKFAMRLEAEERSDGVSISR